MTMEWPKWLAMGSKWAHFTCLCTPNGLGSFLEMPIFDPFLTHFLSQNSPFSRHFVNVEWPKWLAMGSKWAHFTCFGTPNVSRSFLEKHIFDPFLTHFLIQNSPFSRHFVTLEGPKWLAMGSKWSHFTCFGTPKVLGSFLEKPIFDPFLTHFCPFLTHFFVPKQPIFKAFCDFGGAKMACTALKMVSFHFFFGTPNGVGSFLETPIFDPIFTHFLSPNGPFSSHFGILGGPQRATTSSKTRPKHLFGHSM